MNTIAWIYGSIALVGIVLIGVGLYLRAPRSKQARAEKLDAAYYVVDYSRFLLVLGALFLAAGGIVGILAGR